MYVGSMIVLYYSILDSIAKGTSNLLTHNVFFAWCTSIYIFALVYSVIF